MGGSTGGSTKQKFKLPKWYEDAAKNLIAQGEKVSKIGYVPYIGPDVAAFAPQQVAGMQGIADMAAAFNTPGTAAPDIASQIMPATDFGGGLRGYSSYGGFNDAIQALRAKYPALANYLESFMPYTDWNQDGTPAPTPTSTPTPGGGGGGGGLGLPGRRGPFYRWGTVGNPGGGSWTGRSRPGGQSYNMGGGAGEGGLAARGGMSRSNAGTGGSISMGGLY